jgi:hypothetical protein
VVDGTLSRSIRLGSILDGGGMIVGATGPAGLVGALGSDGPELRRRGALTVATSVVPMTRISGSVVSVVASCESTGSVIAAKLIATDADGNAPHNDRRSRRRTAPQNIPTPQHPKCQLLLEIFGAFLPTRQQALIANWQI